MIKFIFNWLLLYLDAHGLVDCSASALDGRSRDGYGTKIHMATDGSGIPLTIVLSPGQAHESQFALRLLDGIGVQREDGSMKYRGRAVLADKVYSGHTQRNGLKRREVKRLSPRKSNEKWFQMDVKNSFIMLIATAI